jgi:hypothetical protein
MLKNPVASFMTSFGHVILRTHLDNMKKDLEKGIGSYQAARQAAPVPVPVPQYVAPVVVPQYAPQPPVRYAPQQQVPFHFQPMVQPQQQEGFHPGRVTPWDARDELVQPRRRTLVVPDTLVEPVSIAKAVQDKMSPLVPVLTTMRHAFKK